MKEARTGICFDNESFLLLLGLLEHWLINKITNLRSSFVAVHDVFHHFADLHVVIIVLQVTRFEFDLFGRALQHEQVGHHVLLDLYRALLVLLDFVEQLLLHSRLPHFVHLDVLGSVQHCEFGTPRMDEFRLLIGDQLIDQPLAPSLLLSVLLILIVVVIHVIQIRSSYLVLRLLLLPLLFVEVLDKGHFAVMVRVDLVLR